MARTADFIQADPAIERKRRLAEAMMASGQSTGPISHWTQGLSKILGQGAGAYFGMQADQEDAERRKAAMAKLTEALAGSGGAPAGGGAQPSAPFADMAGGGMGAPEGPAQPTGPEGSPYGRLISAMSGINPEMALNLRMQQMQQETAAQQAENARKAKLADAENLYRTKKTIDQEYPKNGTGPDIGQYNPRDYTTGSFAKFIQTKDPSVLKRYAAQRSVDIAGVPHVFDPAIGGYLPAVVSDAQGTRPVTTETVAESESAIAGAKTQAQEEAKQSVQISSPEERRQATKATRESEQNIANFQSIVDQADALINNNAYLDSITGIAGKIPAVPGTDKYDALIAFNQFKDTLTLGNLDKMSGILTDRDIQVLASAAGGIEVGMSKPALLDKLRTIRAVFATKSESEMAKLSKIMEGGEGQSKMSEEDADAFINSILGQ